MKESKDGFAEPKIHEKFKEWLSQFQISEGTIKDYTTCMKVFLNEVPETNQETINRFLKAHPRVYYRAFMKYYMRYVGFIPIGKDFFQKNGVVIELPKLKEPDRKPRKEYTFEEMKNLLDSIKIEDKDVYWITRLLLFDGPRIKEVLKLQLNDIDFEKKTIIMHTKGRHIRIIDDLTDDFFSELRKYLIDEKGLLFSDRCFFSNSKNIDSAYTMLRKRIRKFPREASDIIIRTHNFRRAVINLILEGTEGNIAAAKEYIGHLRFESTLEYVSEKQKENLRNIGKKAVLAGR